MRPNRFRKQAREIAHRSISTSTVGGSVGNFASVSDPKSVQIGFGDGRLLAFSDWAI